MILEALSGSKIWINMPSCIGILDAGAQYGKVAPVLGGDFIFFVPLSSEMSSFVKVAFAYCMQVTSISVTPQKTEYRRAIHARS